MASLSRTYDKKKLLGQVYTPAHIVNKILDDVGYDSADALNRTIVDPACGDGRFLVEIVKRITRFSSLSELEKNLNKVYGWDIDKNALELCRKNLNEVIKWTGIEVDWNLTERDALTTLNSSESFDYIVGNPPYIRIQHLSLKQRTFLQENYRFCAFGSTDTFVAFFELASRLMNGRGSCAFITPNSYFFSETAQLLREYFQKNRTLKSITNYGSIRIFEKTGTYAAITVFDRISRSRFLYELSDSDFHYESRKVRFEELISNKLWQLSVSAPTNTNGVMLGDMCQISVGVTTLSDKIYLFKKLGKSDSSVVKVISKNGIEAELESEILRPIIKASRMKNLNDEISEYILFPYRKNHAGKHVIISELILKRDFPLTYNYLLSQKVVLDKRDNGKKNALAWYAFGRAQGLDTSFGEKILFSPMNKVPKFMYSANPDATVYSGYFIKYDGDYQKILPILNSPEMAAYMAVAGRDFRGGWKGYSKKIVEKFRLNDAQMASLT